MLRMTSATLKTSGIRDNHHRGTIGVFLKEKILQGSDLSFVSAYFTIYAYAALKEELDRINHLRFLFGEPQFIQSLDPDKTEKKALRIEDDALLLSNRLKQKRVARECSDWLKSKVDVRSIIKPGLLHFDRNEDGDLDITDHTRQVADLYHRCETNET